MSLNEQWESLPPMSTQRHRCAAAAADGRLFVFGGFDGSSNVLSSAAAYDPRTDTWEISYDTRTKGWTSIPSMSTKRFGCAAAVVGGRLYVFGGSDGTNVLSSVERYDEDSEGWKTLPPMRTKRRCCAAAVVGGQISVCGGEEDSGNVLSSVGNVLSSVEIFDTSLETWSSMASMRTKRFNCAAAAVNNKAVCLRGTGWSLQ